MARKKIQVALCWPTRPQKSEDEISVRRTWTTKCKRYSVVHIVNKFGLPERYLALRGRAPFLRGPIDDKDHRTRATATKVCEKHYRDHQGDA